jgi:hypothetical protein
MASNTMRRYNSEESTLMLCFFKVTLHTNFNVLSNFNENLAVFLSVAQQCDFYQRFAKIMPSVFFSGILLPVHLLVGVRGIVVG